MKKIIAIFISLLMIISLASCTQTEPYSVLEVGGYDNFSGADHQSEITLEIENYSKILKSSKKTVKVNGVDWDVEYYASQKGYLYKNNLDCYEKKSDGVYVQIGINEKTGVVDSYSWVDVNYCENKTDPELSEEDCLNIAKTYLNEFIDSDDYEVINTRYLEIPEYRAIYDFEFVRMIDGVKTSDKANIGVSVFGDVISHLFISLGEMDGAVLPTNEEMQIIQDNVDNKVKDIYDNVSEQYDISYNISDKVLVKLSNGKYAFEYYITVDLKTENISPEITETTKLLIYLD